ncbi:MAG: tol-pal system YbgF family protein [Planctomycetota bacterium]
MISVLLAPLLALTPALPGEEIQLVSGKVLSVKKVTSETFTEVTYITTGGAEGRKPADRVQEVVHNLGSALLNDYVQGLELMEEKGDYTLAIQTFNTVLADSRLMKSRSLPWVRQHVRFRQIRCMFSLADYESVAATADMLLQEVPDTFFYAPALMMKAQAQELTGDRDGAAATFTQLKSDVTAKGLPERWAREAELGLLLLDKSLDGATKRARLQELVEKNRQDHPTVSSRANVEIGNSMVEGKNYARAREFFQAIIDEGRADDQTMASAWAGLGDCAFQQGLALETKKESGPYFQEAILAHLRVATLYRENPILAPRSLCFAAQAYYRLETAEGKSRGKKIVAVLVARFPNSPWTRRCKEILNLR